MPTRANRKASALQHLLTKVKAAFALFAKRWVLALSLIVALIVLSEALRKTVVIDAISVPKQLDDAGYKPEVISAEIRDKSAEIESDIIGTQARKDNLDVEEEKLPDIEVPETKLSILSIVRIVQHLTGKEPWHLSGELICFKADCSLPDNNVEKAPRFEVVYRITNGNRILQRDRFQAYGVEDAVGQLSERLLSIVNPYMLGRYVYQIKNDPRRASSILQDAGETPRYRYRAWAYNALATIQANEAGQLDQAISNYKKAIELKSEEAPQCSLPAWLGRHLCPKSLSFMYCNLGQALVQKGNVPEAERDYSKAKSLGPDSPYLHSLSGDILRAEGKWDEAASEYRVAIGEGLTNDSRIYYELARILWLKGDFDHSLENFRKASDLDPNHKKQIEALILGLTLWLEGNCDPAGEQFRIASQLDPRLKEQIEALTSNKPAVPSKGRC